MRVNRRGVTLIELIIVVAIISIVISVGLSFHLFGVRTFSVGESQKEVQTNVRMASEFIVEEIRYAKEIELISSLDNVTDYNYIYIDNGELVHRINGVDTAKTTGGVIDESLASTFKLESSEDSYFLEFNIEGDKNSQEYKMDSKVKLLNIDSDSTSEGQIIKYKKP